MSAAATAAHFADLTGDLRTMHRVLGRLRDAMLAGRARVVLFDLGDNAVDPVLLGALLRWSKRNGNDVRTRTCATAYVVPSLWARVQWRLALLLDRPPTPHCVVRTRDEATAWLARAVPRTDG